MQKKSLIAVSAFRTLSIHDRQRQDGHKNCPPPLYLLSSFSSPLSPSLSLSLSLSHTLCLLSVLPRPPLSSPTLSLSFFWNIKCLAGLGKRRCDNVKCQNVQCRSNVQCSSNINHQPAPMSCGNSSSASSSDSLFKLFKGHFSAGCKFCFQHFYASRFCIYLETWTARQNARAIYVTEQKTISNERLRQRIHTRSYVRSKLRQKLYC